MINIGKNSFHNGAVRKYIEKMREKGKHIFKNNKLSVIECWCGAYHRKVYGVSSKFPIEFIAEKTKAIILGTNYRLHAQNNQLKNSVHIG